MTISSGARLIVQRQGSVLQTVALTGDVLSVGKEPQNDLVLPDPLVSRFHAEVRRDATGYAIVDKNSTNGVYVGGERLSPGRPLRLSPGDVIEIGPYLLKYEAAGPVLYPSADESFVPQIRVTSKDGRQLQTRELSIGSLLIGRATSCDLVLDSPYVSREHVRVTWDGAQVIVSDLGADNRTWLDGEPLPTASSQHWNWGQTLTVGPFQIRLERAKSAARIGIVLESSNLTLTPGQPTTVRVTVANLGAIVDNFQVSVESVGGAEGKAILESWWRATPDRVNLNPGGKGIVVLTVHVPRKPESLAGVYPIRVRARSLAAPADSAIAPGQWTVLPYADVAMEVTPARAIGRLGATYSVELSNQGNADARYDLSAEDDERTLRYLFTRRSVPLGPGKSATVGLKVEARWRWRGMDQQRGFRLSVTPRGEQPRERQVQFVHRAIVPGWVFTLVMPLIILAGVLGAAYAVGRPPVIAKFEPSPTSVVVGTPVVLSWTLERAASATIEDVSMPAPLAVPSGTLTVQPKSTTRYTLRARNFLGIESSQSVSVEVREALQKPRILSFEATPARLKKEGEPVVLKWKTEGATQVTIDPPDEVKAPTESGEATVHPTRDGATYKLVAANSAGPVEEVRTIAIDKPEVASFDADKRSVDAGEDIRLTWRAAGFTKLTLKIRVGNSEREVALKPEAVDYVDKPIADQEYTLIATNAAGSSDPKSVTVTVRPPQVSFSAQPSQITRGQRATLVWKATGVRDVEISPEVGKVGADDRREVSPTTTTTYTLTAITADGKQLKATATINVTVLARIDIFQAQNQEITKGESTILIYSVRDATRLTIKNSDGAVLKDVKVDTPSLLESSVQIRPDKTTTYILSASNDSGLAEPRSVVVQVRNPTPTAAPPTPAPKP